MGGWRLLVCAALCCAGTLVRAQMWVSPELGVGGRGRLEAALGAPFEEPFQVTVGGASNPERRTLRNRRDYIAVENTVRDAGPAVVANVLFSLGARCDALDLLRGAKPAARSGFAEFSFERIGVGDLPAGLALLLGREGAARADRLTERGGSLAEMEKGMVLRAKSAHAAKLIAPGEWTADLTELARADFLGDGNEELLVRREAAVTGGTLRSSRVYLLARPVGVGPLRIVGERPAAR